MKNSTGHHGIYNNSSSRIPDILLKDESDKILKIAKNTSFRDFTMISLALFTGLRNSELVHLTVFCIAPFSCVVDNLEVPCIIAKGGRSRSIPLHPDIQVLLSEWLNWKVNNSEPVTINSPLFLSKRTKNQLSQRDFQRIIRDISIEAIGRSVHPHILRHTFATRLLSKSNMRIVQKLLGHVNIQTTQIYTHPNRDDFSSAINEL